MDTEGEKVVKCIEKRACGLYYLVKNNGALRQANKLLELEDVEGMQRGNKQLYRSADFVLDLLECSAAVVRQKSKLVGMMFDETTDVSVVSQLCASYALVSKGRAEIVFAGLEELPAGDAETVSIAIGHRIGERRGHDFRRHEP